LFWVTQGIKRANDEFQLPHLIQGEAPQWNRL
jgi:hypothetical protein